jgi:hypothetical protein
VFHLVEDSTKLRRGGPFRPRRRAAQVEAELELRELLHRIDELKRTLVGRREGRRARPRRRDSRHRSVWKNHPLTSAFLRLELSFWKLLGCACTAQDSAPRWRTELLPSLRREERADHAVSRQDSRWPAKISRENPAT